MGLRNVTNTAFLIIDVQEAFNQRVALAHKRNNPDAEAVIVKQVNSSFIGTSLEADLRARGFTKLVITGATSNHCVETTTRMAGNLGFDAHLVRDAIWAFDQIGVDGETLSAEAVHQMTLANLNGEFATITDTANILARIK